MSSTLSDLPIDELEKMLNIRKRDILTLAKKRDKLREELDKVEQEIAQLSGDSDALKKLDRGRYTTRPKNEKSLRKTVIEVLQQNPKGLKLAEVAEKVLATGYKSNSMNFNNVVYQCLYGSREFQHNADTLLYKYVAPKRAKKS